MGKKKNKGYSVTKFIKDAESAHAAIEAHKLEEHHEEFRNAVLSRWVMQVKGWYMQSQRRNATLAIHYELKRWADGFGYNPEPADVVKLAYDVIGSNSGLTWKDQCCKQYGGNVPDNLEKCSPKDMSENDKELYLDKAFNKINTKTFASKNRIANIYADAIINN